jgi:hypothetical protein
MIKTDEGELWDKCCVPILRRLLGDYQYFEGGA